MFTELINFESSSFEMVCKHYLFHFNRIFQDIFEKQLKMLIPNQMLNNQFLTVLFLMTIIMKMISFSDLLDMSENFRLVISIYYY